MNKRSIRKQLGVSLIEVLIALLVFSGGIVTLAKFQGDTSRNRVLVAQHAQAMTVAREKLDDLRHFSVINTAGGVKAYQDIIDGTSTVNGTNVNYTVSWTVTDVVDPPHKVVRVTVSWSDTAGATKSVSLDSVIAEHDPINSGKVMQGL